MRIEPRPLPETLPDLGDLPPLLARLYAARGVRCAEELDKGLARLDRKSTRLNSSHLKLSRMPSSA